MLGSAAQGKFETCLGPFAAAAAPAGKRRSTACAAVLSMKAMLKARVSDEADQAVWTVLQRSVSRSLDYDARLCPWQHLSGPASSLEDACFSLLGDIVGVELDEIAKEQAVLPGHFGGLSLGLLSREKAAAAFKATEVARDQGRKGSERSGGNPTRRWG